MATYPIKMLKDEEGKPFVPLISLDSVQDAEGKNINEILDTKLETTNIKAGSQISVKTEGNNVIISNSAEGMQLIDNLDTGASGVGALDARQGKVLKESIPEIVNNLTTIDSQKALSAHQGYILAGRVAPTGGATGQVLKKASDNDYSFEWGDAADPNAIVGDGSIMKIVELSYEEYLELEAANQLQDDTEYHINNWNENERTYLTEQDIEWMIYDKTANHTTETQVNSMIENALQPNTIQVQALEDRLNQNLVVDHTISTGGTSLTIDGLDLVGDGGIYHLYFTYKGSNSSVSSLVMNVNNFQTGYYTIYSRAWANTPGLGVGEINSQCYYKTNDTSWQCGEIIDDTYGFVDMTIMKAPDGIKMNANQSLLSGDVAYGGTYDCNLYSTPDNLTKITFTNQGGYIQPGSRLVITKGII